MLSSKCTMIAYLKTGLRSPTATNKFPPFLTNKISCFSQNLSFSNMDSQPKSKRPTCSNCSKPVSLCLCTRIKSPNLDNKIHVTILQHSLEKKHPLNSAKIAKIGLRNVDVFTVTDVNFGAQFEFRPLGVECGLGFVDGEGTPGVCGNVSERSEIDGDVEVRRVQKRDFDQFCELEMEVGSVLGSDSERFSDSQHASVSEIAGVGGSRGVSSENDDHLSKQSDVDVAESYEIVKSKDSKKLKEEPLVSVMIGKYGRNSSVAHQGKPLDLSKTSKIEHLVDSPDALGSLAGGFVVKKLQKKKKDGGIELEEFEEFEITVPPGSVLLFPSQNAVAAEALDFEVKNLIVLDGTWGKAKRMYIENPWLSVLPSVRLDVAKLSLFSEVRRQPKPGYLSTIESIVYALEALGETENLSGLDNLLEVFESMVVDQRRFKDESLAKLSST